MQHASFQHEYLLYCFVSIEEVQVCIYGVMLCRNWALYSAQVSTHNSVLPQCTLWGDEQTKRGPASGEYGGQAMPRRVLPGQVLASYQG